MSEERKEKKYQDCLACKHEQQTGHRHAGEHTCGIRQQPGHLDEEEAHPHKKKPW